MSVLRLAALLAVVAGCSSPEPPRDAGGDSGVCEANGATITLGTGTDASLMNFHALQDGDPVYLVPGPQGGQHIWIQLRGRGFDATQPRIDLSAIRVSDGEVLGRLRVRLRMSPAPEDPTLSALSSQTLVLDDDRYCSVLPGDIRVVLQFSDNAGHCMTATRTVRVAGFDPNALEIDRQSRARCCTERLPRCYPDAGM